MPDNVTIDSFSENAFGKIIAATRASNALPGADSHSFYSTFPVFQDGMDDLGKRVLKLAQGLLQTVSTAEAPDLSSIDPRVDDLSARFEDDVLPFLDELYEQVVPFPFLSRRMYYFYYFSFPQDLFIDDFTGEKEKRKMVVAAPTLLQVKVRPP